MPKPSKSIKDFQNVLKMSKRIIVVAGAGLSAASGIPTFRGAGGMWRKYNATSLATPEAFEETPSLVWEFYHYRREVALKAQPNAAHLALAAFSIPQIRHAIAPDSSFTLITQNVDNLSGRANAQVFKETGTTPPDDPPYLLEMHGKLYDLRCTECSHVEFNTSSPVCEGLRGTEEQVENQQFKEIPLNELPRCKQCGSLARPGVVWFGETPWHMDTIDDLVEEADLCLVVGTSSQVFPAAGYAYAVKDNGGKVAVFNFERTNGDKQADFLFLGPCEDLLPKALGLRDTEDNVDG
ncbi:NAD-dependent protein deacylase [Coprinopsis sp. MPI-PUGE-AT-0042]|nr:NAD-dependent protein deacylase [Coprinopsis sp. MPI-PUGE-AT-0042]